MRLLVTIFIILLLQYHCQAVKRKSATSVAAEDKSYVSRTLEEWQSLKLESLRLICNRLSLHARGTREILAGRLFNHFHPNPAFATSTNVESASTATTTESVSVSQPVLQPDIAITNQATQLPIIQPNHNSTTTPLNLDITHLIRTEIQRALATSTTASHIDVDFAPVITHNNPPNHNGNIASKQTTSPFAAAEAASPITPPTLQLSESASAQIMSQHAQPQMSQLLPNIMPSQVEKIKRREYIDFNLLLPESASTPTGFALHVNPDSVGEDSGLSLIPRSMKVKLIDFHSWLIAWNNFMRTYVFFYPDMTAQLMFYQSMICQYAQQYVFEDILAFDRSFRIRVANGRAFGLRWDRYDQDLVGLHLNNFRPICYQCKNYGHWASSPSCPNKSSNNRYTYQASSTTATNNRPQTAQLPFRAPQPPPQQHTSYAAPAYNSSNHNRRTVHCYYYNQSGRCDKPDCRYPHTCESCGGLHARVFCPGRNKRN